VPHPKLKDQGRLGGSTLPTGGVDSNNQGMEQPPQVSAEAVRPWDRPVVVLPVFVLIALVGGLFQSFTLSANLLVLAVGGTMIWVGMTGRAGHRPSPSQLPRAAAWWLVPVLLLAVVELYAFIRHSLEDYPTLSLLADPMLEGYLARSACYFGWLAAFWGLIRR